MNKEIDVERMYLDRLATILDDEQSQCCGAEIDCRNNDGNYCTNCGVECDGISWRNAMVIAVVKYRTDNKLD